MLRSLEYAFPHRGYATVMDELLLGEDILVAPQLQKGGAARKVVIPEGEWEDLGGNRYQGRDAHRFHAAGVYSCVYQAPLGGRYIACKRREKV